MKVEPRLVAGFLRNPGECRGVLLHGSDAGLIRERAAALTVTIAGSKDDPFRVVELGRDRAADLVFELAALSLIGGRRVVVLRDANDSCTDAVKRAIEAAGSDAPSSGSAASGFAIVEAGELAGRSKLKTLFEATTGVASIGCYQADARDRPGIIRDLMQECGINSDREASEWLAANLSGDRAMIRGEIEKLALAVGAEGRVDITVARESVGDLAELSLEDALFAATTGDVPGADRAIERALADGAAAVQIVRSAAMHFQRLHLAAIAASKGITIADAVRVMRPPVFYQRVPGFTQSVSRWPVEWLNRALNQLNEAERLCKRSGLPAEMVARSTILALAMYGAALGRRRQA